MSDEQVMAMCVGGPEAGREYPAKIPGTTMAMDVYADTDDAHVVGSVEYVAQLYTTAEGGIPVWIPVDQGIHETMMLLLQAYKQVHRG